MNKFGLQDLAAAIAEKHGLEHDKAEILVKTFFETIEDGLKGDKSVKIKGLGTFKIVEVEPRESVNVNTGGRVIIEGHEKINFSPEAALRDLVNKPFAQFETVVLNDGTDFSELKNTTDDLLENLNDDPFSVTENIEGRNEFNSSKELEGDLVTESTVEKGDPLTDSSEKINESQEEETLNIESETEDQEEPIHILSELSEETVVSNAVVEDNPSKEKTIIEEQIPQKEFIDQSNATDKNKLILEETSVEEENKDDNLKQESGDDKKNHTINETILILVIALVCYAGGYMTSAFFPLDKLLSIFNPVPVEKPVIQKKVSSPVVKKKSVAMADVNPAMKNAGTQAKVEENEVTTSHQEKISVEKSQPKDHNNFDSEKYDKENRQVRYGAYRIVGVAKTIKLKYGQTLNYIAKRDFGSKDMLCYILALNEMNADSQVKEGQTILIPKLELRHKKEK
jgi:nucleoid DNA-binding protein